jgi:hypothetical protein
LKKENRERERETCGYFNRVASFHRKRLNWNKRYTTFKIQLCEKHLDLNDALLTYYGQRLEKLEKDIYFEDVIEDQFSRSSRHSTVSF